MRVLALDPGGTTGWAFADTDTGFVEFGEVGNGLFGIMPLVIMSHDLDNLVVESFTITAHTAKIARSNDALYIIGTTWWHCKQNDIAFTLQKPADRKFATPEKFKRLGWNPTGDHATQAAKHLLLFLFRQGLIEPEALVSN